MNRGVYNPGIQERNKAVIRVIWVTLGLNWLIAAIKIMVGALSGSVTVTADGLHAIIDGTNNVLGILALKIASKPADEDHPYGHQKFENLAAMIIGGLIFVIGWEVVQEVISKLYSGFRGSLETGANHAPRFEWLYVILLLLTLAANAAISTYEWRAGKKLQSSFLTADALHTRSDMAVTTMGLLSLILGSKVWWLDSILATVVIGFIFYAGWCIVRENMDVFTDRVRLNPVDVRAVVDAVPGVLNTHAIRSHGNATSVHLDLHIVIPESSTAREAEDIEARVREALLMHFPNLSFVSIHHQTSEHDEKLPLWVDHEEKEQTHKPTVAQ